MTEVEWLACTDPMVMLARLGPDPQGRKVLLLMHACLHRLGSHLPEGVREWMKAGDKVIRGKDSYEAARVDHFIEDLESSLSVAASAGPPSLTGVILAVEAMCFQNWLMEPTADVFPRDSVWEAETKEKRVHSALVRCIFGNPFRSDTTDSAWFTPNVKQLAEAIYEEKAFDRMPILGDALEEAGCDNAGILNHCRQPGEHARGCWVVDLLLGKS